ncbi:UNVERIFIED_CONTAM: hypothetical protein Slati_4513000 [Sesamum latifolium]|uniref:Uncharacterized protein n=1 Tax=Sesamum latifolium TaxID=2727402 RepID=A0AAW2SSU0_9LAMI
MRLGCQATAQSCAVIGGYMSNFFPLSRTRSAFPFTFASLLSLKNHPLYPWSFCKYSSFRLSPGTFSSISVSVMASSDESVHFLGENHPDEDPSKATSKSAGSQSSGPSSGRRRSLRRMQASFRRLIDEEEEETGGNEGEASSPGEEGRVVMDLVAVPSSSMVEWGSSTLKSSTIIQLRREFFIPNSMIIYTLGPDGRVPSPLANCLSLFVAQL